MVGDCRFVQRQAQLLPAAVAVRRLAVVLQFVAQHGGARLGPGVGGKRDPHLAIAATAGHEPHGAADPARQ